MLVAVGAPKIARCARRSVPTPTRSSSPTWPARPQPGADHPRLARLRRPPRRPGARHRRADLGRAQRRRARRVPAARGAAQPRLRRGRIPAAVPVRRRDARRERRSTRPAAATRSSTASPASALPRRGAAAAPFDSPLPPPPARARLLGFELDTLADAPPGRESRRAGLGQSRREDLVLAVDELATNSVRHGGGRGILRIWRDAAHSSARSATAAASPTRWPAAARPRSSSRRPRPVDRQPGLRPRADPPRAQGTAVRVRMALSLRAGTSA